MKAVVPSGSVEDIFRVHPLTVFKWFLFTVSALLLPFDVNHFVQGRHALAGVLGVMILLFLVSAIRIQLREDPLVIFLPIAGTLWLANANQGITSASPEVPITLASPLGSK